MNVPPERPWQTLQAWSIYELWKSDTGVSEGFLCYINEQ